MWRAATRYYAPERWEAWGTLYETMSHLETELHRVAVCVCERECVGTQLCDKQMLVPTKQLQDRGRVT